MKHLLLILIVAFSITGAKAQWVSNGINGYYQDINYLVANDSSVFAVTSAGVFLSVDKGNSWTEVDSGWPRFPAISSLAISGSNIFAGNDSGGVFLSTNNGAYWMEADSGIAKNAEIDSNVYGNWVSSFIFIGSNIYVGTANGLYLSTNSGGYWQPLDTDSQYFINQMASIGSNIFASDFYGNLFQISDTGRNWTEINDIPGMANSVAVYGSKIFVGLLGISAGSGPGGVALSVDTGKTWELIGTLPYETTVFSFAFNGPNAFIGTSKGVFYTDTNCYCWKLIGFQDSYIYSLAIGGSMLFAGDDSGYVYQESLAVATGIQAPFAPEPAQFTLYPNPSTCTMQLSISNELTGSELNIYDEEGRLVFHSKLETQNSQLDLGLASGIYIATLKSATSVATQKLVVER